MAEDARAALEEARAAYNRTCIQLDLDHEIERDERMRDWLMQGPVDGEACIGTCQGCGMYWDTRHYEYCPSCGGYVG